MISFFRRKPKTPTEVPLMNQDNTLPTTEFEVGANALAKVLNLSKQDSEYLMHLLNSDQFKLVRLEEIPVIEQPSQAAVEKSIRISDGQEARIVDLLRMIVEKRGRCGVCKLDCEGSGAGTIPSFCPNADPESSQRPCFWEPGDDSARARLILNIF